jgi:hypothetical protein
MPMTQGSVHACLAVAWTHMLASFRVRCLCCCVAVRLGGGHATLSWKHPKKFCPIWSFAVLQAMLQSGVVRTLLLPGGQGAAAGNPAELCALMLARVCSLTYPSLNCLLSRTPGPRTRTLLLPNL